MSLLLEVRYPVMAYNVRCPWFIGCFPQGEDGRGINILLGWLCLIPQTEDLDPHLVDNLIVFLIDLESLVTENFVCQSSRRRTSSLVRHWPDCNLLQRWSIIL